MNETSERVLRETQAWLTRAVIGLNLCPFAKAVQAKKQIRFVVSEASSEGELLAVLRDEMVMLAQTDPEITDTTLVIHPRVLNDFLDFNDFLGTADILLDELEFDGVLQVASFHPQFRFAGTEAGDITNATNRSPYPTLHLLREASVDRAVSSFPDPGAIFEANMHTLETLGAPGWARLQARCKQDAD